ncbi:hypothetical protein GCM10025868_39240 [Angustibacter aerolatus]|uniref:Methylmalonyl-CoA mutase alpha/beta chain catalytic domain-containing protein n=1 Tax=Angustibacter aerolatus TaxID=1162965 RepID=A0ABQ6JMW8_9ACTN|nr:hypothetical protein GCM10025868_39240 [Angustibacter aerolatus]
MILARGGGGLSVAFDMPTLMGRDSDEPVSLGEVGHCGVAIDSAADMETLFAGIPLGDVTTSMTISGPAVPVFCMYLVAAERQGVDLSTLDGTLQTDIFKEYIAQKEWLFGPEPHLRLIGDLMEFCAERIPAYKPLSVSGYHIREAGSTAAQEPRVHAGRRFRVRRARPVARARRRPLRPGPRFFFDAHVDFFEEIAKFRAARRIWARWLRDVYGATTDRAQWLRFHTQTAGVSLTAQQPVNNVVRTAVEALAAVLGGTNSLHTNALDETLALPTDESAEIALRTQQVLMAETGVVNVADPLGGSWYVEELTDRIEAEAEAVFERIREMGERGRDRDADGAVQHDVGPMTSGILRGIEDGWFTGEIAEAAFRYQTALEKGDKQVVGVNVHTESLAREPRDPAGQPRGRARAGAGAHRAPCRPRRGARAAAAGGDGRGGPRRRQPGAADARRRAGGGDARRDLRRAARGVGLVPRARPVLTGSRGPAAVRRPGDFGCPGAAATLDG